MPSVKYINIQDNLFLAGIYEIDSYGICISTPLDFNMYVISQ